MQCLTNYHCVRCSLPKHNNEFEIRARKTTTQTTKSFISHHSSTILVCSMLDIRCYGSNGLFWCMSICIEKSYLHRNYFVFKVEFGIFQCIGLSASNHLHIWRRDHLQCFSNSKWNYGISEMVHQHKVQLNYWI